MPPTLTELRKDTYRTIWTGDASFATTLLVLFVDTYGTEGFTWDPETIRMEIEDDFGVKLPQANYDRLITAIRIVTSDDFNQSLPDFVSFCNILSGDTYDPRTWDPAEAIEIAWGVTEAMIIEPPDGEEPFTEEIRAYIGAVLDSEGIMQPPDVLRLAIRDKDLKTQVQGDFSDDPMMFNAINDFEKGKTDEINTAVRNQLMRLSQQLEALPVRSGSTKGVVEQMLRSLS